MITNSAATQAYDILNQLRQKQVRLAPVSGSIIEELVQSSIGSSLKLNQHDFDQLNFVSQLQSDSRVTDMDGTTEHDAIMEDAEKTLSDRLEANLHLARSEVRPAVEEIYNRYADRLEQHQIDTRDPVVIYPNVYHSIFDTEHLRSMLSRYENTPLESHQLEVPWPSMETSQIENMLYTGITEFDQVINDYIEDIGEDMLRSAFEKIFIDRMMVGQPPAANHYTDNGLTRTDLLIAFLITTNFEDHIPEGMNVALPDLRVYMSRLRDAAGKALLADLRRRQGDRRQKNLVFRVYTKTHDPSMIRQKQIFVNNEVYQDYLEEGGSPEAIYGAILAEEPYNYHALLENQDRYERIYQQRKSIHNQKNAAELFEARRDSARLAIGQYIHDCTDDQLPVHREKLQTRLQNELARMEPEDFHSHIGALRDLVCNIMYPHTHVKRILKKMEESERKNPGYKPREHAYYAAIDFISRWLAEQVIYQ